MGIRVTDCKCPYHFMSADAKARLMDKGQWEKNCGIPSEQIFFQSFCKVKNPFFFNKLCDYMQVFERNRELSASDTVYGVTAISESENAEDRHSSHMDAFNALYCIAYCFLLTWQYN